MIPAKDISQYQGNWQDTGEPIVMIKMSGGDAGLYFDSKANQNYESAKAASKHVGGYHFIGWTMGAAQEASWFWRAMSPVAENDVFALDVENGAVAVPANAPAYVEQMIDYLAGQGVKGGLLYMNLATLNAHDWSGPLSRWGLWLADWAVSPNDTIPTNHTYVMQQYNDGPNYDHDEWFGTLAQFDAYGYHAPVIQAPAPLPPPPAPAPAPSPVPETPPTPTAPSPQPPVPQPQPESPPSVVVKPTIPPVQKPVLAPLPKPQFGQPLPVIQEEAIAWYKKVLLWLKDFFT